MMMTHESDAKLSVSLKQLLGKHGIIYIYNAIINIYKGVIKNE